MEKKIVLYDSPEAATYRTNIEGWVSSEGKFYGKEEHVARWAGCTHMKCECGNIYPKGYTTCIDCRIIKEGTIKDKYLKRTFKEWDGVTPLVLFNDDKFFWSADDVIEYVYERNEDEEEEYKIKSTEDLLLMIASPNYMRQIDTDYWEEILGEDQELPKEIQDKLDELNELISKAKPLSWGSGKYRTTVNLKLE